MESAEVLIPLSVSAAHGVAPLAGPGRACKGRKRHAIYSPEPETVTTVATTVDYCGWVARSGVTRSALTCLASVPTPQCPSPVRNDPMQPKAGYCNG